MSSPIVRGPRVAFTKGYLREPAFLVPDDYEEGRAFARYASSRGVDFLKPYDSLPEDAFRGLLDEAEEVGLYVGGHVPKSLTRQQALDLSLRTVEHGRMLPLACSAAGPHYAETFSGWLADSDSSSKKPSVHDLLGDLLERPDHEACETVFEQWAATETHYVPTHVTRLADTLATARPFVDDPRALYVPDTYRLGGWEYHAAAYEKYIREQPGLDGRLVDSCRRGVELTGSAHAAGVKLLIGTDSGDAMIYPGPSFHEEMGIYADAGIAPSSMLAAATSVPASFAGLSHSYGSVDAGKRADLVFLEDNPLDDIVQAQSIEALYVGAATTTKPPARRSCAPWPPEREAFDITSPSDGSW